jgi:adenylate cyclase class 2
MPTPTETEAKFYTPDLKALEQRLREAGASLKAPRVFERNVRYENADQTLSQQGLVLRLRQDTRVRLTYKEPGEEKPDMSSRPEWEVEVSDFEAMDTILGKLGYTPYLIYEKYRTTYELEGAEIVLDEMPYGHFTEIEGEEDTIRALVKTLGLQEATPQPSSYVRLFDQVKQALNLSFQDLTFKNFEGITVPGDLFSK